MKKIRLLTLAAVAFMGLTACGGNTPSSSQDPTSQEPTSQEATSQETTSEDTSAKPYEGVKVGLICLHPAASSTYDKNFREAFEAAADKLGFTPIVRENIDESDDCQTCAEQMAEDGCKLVFADSFGHEDYMMAAAENYPDVYFCHATGTQAGTSNLPNFFNAFAAIYEGRYLAGVTAGLKLLELYGDDITAEEAKVGYVGAFPYAEVKSGYTSWFLGLRSVVPNATMEVTFTNSWYDENAEKEAANLLIGRGARLISQHADSYGAPNACEQANIPNVSYNGSTEAQCPNTFLVSSKINWQPYYEHAIECYFNEELTLEKDYVGTVETGSVQLTDFGAACAEGTAAYVENVKAELAAGTRHIFDVNSFTVGGEEPSEANVAPDKQWTFNYPDGTLFLRGGFYNESVYRSAPSFDVNIDGITLLN